jgi:hypothetical protein
LLRMNLRIFDGSLVPCSAHFAHVTEGLSLTIGNLAAASRTQRHTRLKCLRVRSCYLPWNQPRGARCAAVCESAGIDRQLGRHSPAAA